MADHRLGHITIPDRRSWRDQHPAGTLWAADNGCYGLGWPGFDAWFQWLRDLAWDASRCWFATAPDVVGDARATLERSGPWLPRIRSLGYPAALVAQDGLEDLEVPWEALDVLFLGGSTDWKLSEAATELAREAIQRGKRVHMGRVNSHRRYRHATEVGCHSVDGTFLTYGPETNLPQVLAWTAGVTPQSTGYRRVRQDRVRGAS